MEYRVLLRQQSHVHALHKTFTAQQQQQQYIVTKQTTLSAAGYNYITDCAISIACQHALACTVRHSCYTS